MSDARYSRNIKALSAAESEALREKKVCVVGLGGLGGYVVEILARIGVLNITAVDYDVFEQSNLNRQLFSTEPYLGRPKADGAVERIRQVNSAVRINPVKEKFTETSAPDILRNHDCVVDALDNIQTRLVLEDACERLNIPLVHGSIAGWYGQVASIFPGERLLRKIYKNTKTERGGEKELGNLPFTASTIASMQAAEAVKILCGRATTRNALIQIDLLDMETQTLRL